MNDTETIFIDGSIGEGGGQILRTSLALSCITGKRLHIENIRSYRHNPGLAKQHVCCVRAACQICDGKSKGAKQGSKVLDFQPDTVHGGRYCLDIGSAGSVSLVNCGAAVDYFLADQLLIYMAILNSGCYTIDKISKHTKTNIEVIKKFLPVDFVTEQQGNLFRVTCQPAQ